MFAAQDGAGADGGPTPRFAAYGASKRSLEQLSKSLQVGFPLRCGCLAAFLVDMF